MTFPTVAAVAKSTAAAGSSQITVTMPSGIVSGSLVLVFVVGSATVTDKDYTMTGWTQVAEHTTVASSACTGVIFYRFCDGTEGADETCTWATGNQAAAAYAVRFAGHHASTAPEASTDAIGSTANPDPGSLNPAGWGTEDTLWIAFAGQRASGGSIDAFPTNYSGNQDSNTTSARWGFATRDLNGASDDPGTFTFSGAAGSIAWTVGIRPAPAAYSIAAGAGSYALTGTNASLLHGWKLAAAAGSYTTTGTDASLKHGWKVAADAGSYAQTGTNAATVHAWKVAAAIGSYTLTGTNASLILGRVIAADAGSYALTGTNATLTLAASAGLNATPPARIYGSGGFGSAYRVRDEDVNKLLKLMFRKKRRKKREDRVKELEDAAMALLFAPETARAEIRRVVADHSGALLRGKLGQADLQMAMHAMLQLAAEEAARLERELQEDDNEVLMLIGAL